MHTGYKGGLESEMMVDGCVNYFCTSTTEIIFHDVTRMLTDQADLKQLKKKRHIGNDHVHIIWNESHAEYNWDTIGGDFGNVQIAITPLHNGMFRVSRYEDPKLSSFGILLDHCVVAKAALATLVRHTALNAYRSALAGGTSNAAQPHPYDMRKEMIELVANRYSMHDQTFEHFITEMLACHVKSTIISNQ